MSGKPAPRSAPTPLAAGGSDLTDHDLRGLWREVDAAIDAQAERLVKLRRRIHAAPEPAHEETATTALVADTLRERGLEPIIGDRATGVIVDIDLGAASNTRIALRAELDCVRINDDKQVAYASTRPGLCHACGHDAHSTIAVAAALAFADLRDRLAPLSFRHNVRVFFQPAEETATGARAMISQGAIDGVEAILALHVDPFLDVGIIGLRKGALTSASKSFTVKVRGRSGHSARPHEALDPIPTATNIVSLFYQLCPRSIDSRSPLALTVTSIAAGSSHNAIPNEATIHGTLRTTRAEDTDVVQRRMESVVRSVAEATGCEAELGFPFHCPPTDNDDRVIDVFTSVTEDLLGPEAVHWLDRPSLGAEDFGFYQELIPGAMARLGVAMTGRPRRPLHSSLFDIDESALLIGAKLMGRSGLALATGRWRPG